MCLLPLGILPGSWTIHFSLYPIGQKLAAWLKWLQGRLEIKLFGGGGVRGKVATWSNKSISITEKVGKTIDRFMPYRLINNIWRHQPMHFGTVCIVKTFRGKKISEDYGPFHASAITLSWPGWVATGLGEAKLPHPCLYLPSALGGIHHLQKGSRWEQRNNPNKLLQAICRDPSFLVSGTMNLYLVFKM